MAALGPRGRFLLCLASASILALLRPHHLCECLEPLRGLDAAACQGRQDSAEQTGAVSDDPDAADLDDQDLDLGGPCAAPTFCTDLLRESCC
jgi:hypothetical protein